MGAALAGFGSGMGLIVAIGAQNAFVLRHGVRREHIFWICLVCAASDALLIALGVLGLGAVIERAPLALDAMRLAGIVFLSIYAALAIKRALRPSMLAAEPDTPTPVSLGAALVQTVAFTYLNPHVYLDTVMLLGSIANTHGPALRWLFAAGATLASFVWFFALGYGARFIAPLLAKPAAWRVFDMVIAATMLAVAVTLALGATTADAGP
jgi:L-lysine exporter family protein LysE/ArgO